MKETTRIDWESRVDRVLRLLSGSLDYPPDLESAAREAASSPWHFHRAFRSLVGESFTSCLRRLRLERAAFLLREGRSVLTVSLESGFDSPEAFSRAFFRAFGLTPSRVKGLPWWKGEIPSPNGLHFRPDRDPVWFFGRHEAGPIDRQTRIVNLPSMRLATRSGTGDLWGLPALWESLASTLAAAEHSPAPGEFLSIFETSADLAITAFRAACILGESIEPPAGTEACAIPGGTYALTAYVGPCEAIGTVWENARETFFPSSGWERDPSRPSLEWYQNRPPEALSELTVTFLCDPICWKK